MFTYFGDKTYRSETTHGALEIGMRVRKEEKQRAMMMANLVADAAQKPSHGWAASIRAKLVNLFSGSEPVKREFASAQHK